MDEAAGESGRTFGHYEVESVLGRGAMGLVYLARDRRIGRRVALKTVHVEERFDDESEAGEFYQRLQREAELGGALQHPNIVTLYEPGYENDVIAWLATEYIDGESLRDRLRKRKPLPLKEALRIAVDVMRGLAFAHSKGIVHRDIKPANILITSAGEAKIADFGIARPPDSNLTAVGEMLGTPSYMSPEQVRCTTVTPRSDLFSAGALFYEIMTGVKAFAAADVSSILRNVVEHHPKPAHVINPEIPEDLSRLLARLMAKAPEERYESAAAALEELVEIKAEIDDTEPEPELMHEEAGVATVAGPGSVPVALRTHPTATDVDFDDETPALSRPPTLRRRVSRTLFFSTIAVLLAGLTVSALAIRSQTDSTPTYIYSPLELAEFQKKREALAAARALYSAGKNQESIAAYQAYLTKYPQSAVAREELAEAQEALKAAEAEKKVTVSAKRPKRSAPPKEVEKPPEEPKKKRSLWRRIFTND